MKTLEKIDKFLEESKPYSITGRKLNIKNVKKVNKLLDDLYKYVDNLELGNEPDDFYDKMEEIVHESYETGFSDGVSYAMPENQKR